MSNEQPTNKRIAFIDRDGVINKKAPDHSYVTRVNDFVFNEGIFDVMSTLQKDGFELIVITNQRGISRGQYSEHELHDIHQHMLKVLTERSINILDIFYCPHSLDECDCRKPKPGLLKQACAKYPINIRESILISDSSEDVSMGAKFGFESNYLVPHDKPEIFFDTYKKRIKIAFIKYGGLTSGGTEKMLQTIAANVSRKIFQVDYFYCNGSPYHGSSYKYPKTDPDRYSYMLEKGVNVIEFSVSGKDITRPTHPWLNTNFWEKFDENNYDIIQTGRAGHKEYPFTKIKHTPIIDILALNAGVDNQFNISRVLHVSKQNAQKWIKNGGDKKRIEIISLPIETSKKTNGDLRAELGLENKFVYGMHQRPSDAIFSEIPLKAYQAIETKETAFILLGGSTLYQKQAAELKIKNIFFLPETGNQAEIFKFLNTLNVYSHGRLDGEVNSQAMAEAMFYGLPIVSHISKHNNGHIENIGRAGLVTKTISEYIEELQKLKNDTNYYSEKRTLSKQRFLEHYELGGQIKKMEDIYLSVLKNPFPHRLRRLLYQLHWTQNLRLLLKWVYLKLKT